MSELQDHLAITTEDGEREIFMSFALLNEVTRLIGDPARAASVFFNVPVREAVLLTMLAERDKRGKPTKEFDSLDEVGASFEQMEELLAWGVQHALGFFARSVRRIVEMKGTMEEVERLTSSLAGSAASPSRKPSSGR